MSKRKILFLGEAYRADAQTWMNGLKEFGDFEIITWEMNEAGSGWRRLLRFAEYFTTALWRVRKLVAAEKPDMVIAERTTSFGFLAAMSGCRPIAVAQQGITDLYPPGSPLIPLKRWLQQKAFKQADIIHAWGPAMAGNMEKAGADMRKVLVMPKGIDLRRFVFQPAHEKPVHPPRAIVTRSLGPEYRHLVVLEAARQLKDRGKPVHFTIVGDGPMRSRLQAFVAAHELKEWVHFTGRIPNQQLPELLGRSLFYVSMPITEGVSSSLFEAMAAGCYPLVTDLPGNQSWIRHGQNGQLIPVDDATALANALADLQGKADEVAEATQANRSMVEQVANFNHNMKQIADKYHALIDSVQASRQ